ncbi:MAG: hypothetical protein AAGC88_05780 [Bacteroidota bacterium]
MKRVRYTLIVTLLLLATSTFSQPIDLSSFSVMKPRNIGPAGMSGRVTAVDVVTNDPDVIYVGTASGGLWKSTGGGIAFEPIFDKVRSHSIGAVAINQQNPSEVWVGTGEGNPRNSQSSGNGVYRSLDGGKNWEFMGLESSRNIHRILIHPQNPKVIYVGVQGSAWGAHSDRGVYRTQDGGKTWSQVLSVNDRTGVADMVMDPTNPNKLIVAMWEFKRDPWFFKSGGAGSGIYLSVNGGDSWKQQGSDDGLPSGELGRSGLAIAPSNPNVVYALVESKKNGLYKSTDGGYKWSLVTTKNIGGRPFYYADIFVDPTNENRLYNVWTHVDVSEDGGKTFSRFIDAGKIHVDHHALYIHPENPEFIINGGDGGLAITRDKGQTWKTSENLPLGQFYHISVDNQIPYYVYGGMQDNGSWRGPSQVWRRGSIRNQYWDRIGYGDGFDAVPDPFDSRYSYSQLQQGSLLRNDSETGELRNIKPVALDDTKLRFNWNAGIALDPFDKNIIYFGAQHLLKSTDKGESWEIISPDLTTNDPEKQKQPLSGGLTFDGSGAENYTTILTIAPSTLEQGLIWVGTDDGNVQLTRDAGASWSDVTKNMKIPSGGWVHQITASSYNAGEAYATVNYYRSENDWTPYLMRTTDYGKSWRNIARADQIYGYALSFAQDTVEPKLMFLGTEFGLYVSFDAGANWQIWTHGYPYASTMDLAIHPREHDLIIGTFGRAAWVLDDIRPLRVLASEGSQVLNSSFKVFDAPLAYLAFIGESNGYRSTGDALYAGENKDLGALLSFYVNELAEVDGKKVDSVKVEISNQAGDLVRTFHTDVASGLNRFTWSLNRDGVRFPGTKSPKKYADPRSGTLVVPGDYVVKMTYNGLSESTTVKVGVNPKITTTPEQMAEKSKLFDEHYANVKKATTATDQIRDAKADVTRITAMMKDQEVSNEEIDSLHKTMKKDLDGLLYQATAKEIQGFSVNPELIESKLFLAQRYLQSPMVPANPSQRKVLEESIAVNNDFVNKVNEWFEKNWASYQEKIKGLELSLF